jgi:serpin B
VNFSEVPRIKNCLKTKEIQSLKIQHIHKSMSKEFSTKIFNDILKKDSTSENIIASTFSTYLALLMTGNGATGNTFSEFEQLLHLQPNIESANEHVLSLYNQLHNNVLSIANALFISDKFNVEQKFLDTISESFQSNSQVLNFGQAEASRSLINNWVEKNTNKKIKDLIPRGSICGLTKLVLVNAIYFKQDWSIQFKKELTRKLPFDQTAQIQHNVDTMTLSGQQFKYGSNDKAQWIHLPYKNNKISMVLVLPTERFGLDQIHSDVLSGTIPVLSKVTQKKITCLKLPKFKFEYTIELSTLLKELGLKSAFGASASFANITKSNDIYISNVFHKAFIQVDEEGTEAAAATAVIMRKECKRPKVEEINFICDQPFLFMIVHNQTSTVLFEGKVVRPMF